MERRSVRDAIEAIHDALDAADLTYHDRSTGIVDTTSEELAVALLRAGWTPPAPADAEIQAGTRLAGFCGGAFGRESYGDKVVEAVGPDWVVAREVDANEPQFYWGDPQRLTEGQQ